MSVIPSEATVSNQLATALKDTLVANLGDYITLPANFGANNVYLMSALWLQAALSPAICIDEQGETLRTQFCKGSVGTGEATFPGFQLVDYRFDIEVWVEAREAEFARSHVNIWRDGIKAMLNDYETLGGKWAAVTARTSEPPIEGQIGSRSFWGGVVHCNIVAGSFRGELALATGN